MTPLNLFSNAPKYCGEAATTTLSGKAAVKPKNPPAKGRSNLRTFPYEPVLPVYLYLPFCDTINQL